MQPFIFGSGYDAVAGQRNQYDAQALRLAEADRAARQQAIDQNNQFQWQAGAARAAQTQQSNQEAMQMDASARADRDRAAQEAQGKYEFGANLEQRQSEEKSKVDFSNRELTFKQKQMETNDLLNKQEGDYSEVTKRIDRGEIDDPAKIPTLFPNLTPIQLSRANEYWSHQNQAATEDYKQLVNVASAATAAVKASKTPLPTKAGGFLGFGTHTVTGTVPKLSNDEAMAELAKNKSFSKSMPGLQWDEASQQFTPIYRAPKGFALPAAPGMTPPGNTGARPVVTSPPVTGAPPTVGAVVPPTAAPVPGATPAVGSSLPQSQPSFFSRMANKPLDTVDAMLPWVNPQLSTLLHPVESAKKLGSILSNPWVNPVPRFAYDAMSGRWSPPPAGQTPGQPVGVQSGSGVDGSMFPNAASVKAALASGAITREQAMAILQKNF